MIQIGWVQVGEKSHTLTYFHIHPKITNLANIGKQYHINILHIDVNEYGLYTQWRCMSLIVILSDRVDASLLQNKKREICMEI